MKTYASGTILKNLHKKEQQSLIEIFVKASLKKIASTCRFPDWLGHMGLALFYTQEAEVKERRITQAWVPQLIEMLPQGSQSVSKLDTILLNISDALGWENLEMIEFDLRGSSFSKYDIHLNI